MFISSHIFKLLKETVSRVFSYNENWYMTQVLESELIFILD